MKKSFIALCATVLAFAACQKEEVKVVPELKVSSETAITVEKDGGIFTVDFESNVAWTAAVDVEKEVAYVNVTSGTTEDKKVKVTVTPLKEDNAVRVITLTLTPENGEGVKVVFTQNGPFVPYFKVSTSELNFGKEGGSQTFTIETNCDKTKITVENPTVGTIQINDAFTEATFTMPAATSWSAITDRVKFTVEEIQDPVKDDDGNETGETEAHTERVYANLEGYGHIVYATEFTDALTEGTTYNTALAGDYFLVANGTDKIHMYDKDTGEYVQAITAVGATTGLCNDEAGNIVLMTGGAYGEEADPMVTYFIPAATPFDSTTYKEGFSCYNQFYGFGYNNISANGNVIEGDALIDVFSATSGSYNVCFALKDGKRTDEGQYTDYVGIPLNEGTFIWNSKWGVARHVSTAVEGGIFYSGYADEYELFYNATMSSANWTKACASGSDWSNGVVSMEYAQFNGHKYLVAYSYSFVPGMYSYIVLFNIDDPAAPVLKDRFPVIAGAASSYTTADMSVEVVDGNLNVYIADYTQYAVIKCVLPPLK